MRAHSDDGRLLTGTLFTALLAAALVGVALFVTAGSDTFSVSATVQNDAPTITINAGQTVQGQAAGSKAVYVYFNATDANGRDDLDDATANVTINKTGNTARSSSSCTHENVSANTKQYNCTVTIWYYDESGDWTINASVRDDSTNEANNDTESVSIDVLDSVAVVTASVSFTGSPGTNNVAASPNPQSLNNTGNQEYATVNVTGYNFLSGSDLIGVTNVTVNVADTSGTGQTLTNSTEIEVTAASLARGEDSIEQLYFWLDIPAAQPSGSYDAESDWVLEAIQ